MPHAAPIVSCVHTGIQAEARLPFAGLHQLLQPVLALAERLPPRQRTALLSAFGRADAEPAGLFLTGLLARPFLNQRLTGRGELESLSGTSTLDRTWPTIRRTVNASVSGINDLNRPHSWPQPAMAGHSRTTSHIRGHFTADSGEGTASLFYAFGMGRGRMFTVAVCGLLLVAGVVGWRTLARTSPGTFDPLSAVIALVGLAVSVAAFGLAVRAQRQADTDVTAMAGRLAVAVGHTESEARRQLLTGDHRAIDVRFTFHPAAAHNAAGADNQGTMNEVVTYYRKLEPRRMVITGAAGSGKTVLAVELILGLLKNREVDAPVPIRMSAAALDTSRPTEFAVADWLTEHLRQTYHLPKVAAQQLVNARMVTPVLDGLDEMDTVDAPGYSSRAGQAIRACNAYIDGADKAAIILTCRIGQYESLEQAHEWVHDAARIQLRPVNVAAARSFLTRRVTDKDRWQPVLSYMRRRDGKTLAAALATPWRLTLAATVYDQRDPATGAYTRDPADLTAPEFDAEKTISDHLLSLFILAAVTAHKDHYPPDRVHRWLGTLARYLDGNSSAPGRSARAIAGRTLSSSDLVLHELWPLAGSRAPRILSVAIVTALSAGLATLMLTQVSIGFSLQQIIGAAPFTLLAILGVALTWDPWPSVQALDLRLLKTNQKQRWREAGLVGVMAFGFTMAVVDVLAIALVRGFVNGLAGGIAAGFVAWLGVSPDEYSVADPRQIIRGTFTGGLAVGLVVGSATVLSANIVVTLSGSKLLFGLMAGLAVLLAFGPLGMVTNGFPGLRYVALLLCTRRWSDRWVPWRLAAFLNWCYQAGLLRVAGISYQFRHRELQDYLARNPAPPDAGTSPGVPQGKSTARDQRVSGAHRSSS